MVANLNTPAASAETATGLLRRLVDDVSMLFRQELALARAELAQSVEEAKAGIAGIAVGGAVLYAGILTLLAAAVLGLAIFLPAWSAALLVGGVAAIAGYAMMQSARRKLKPSHLKPGYTQESLRRDREIFQRRSS